MYKLINCSQIHYEVATIIIFILQIRELKQKKMIALSLTVGREAENLWLSGILNKKSEICSYLLYVKASLSNLFRQSSVSAK